MEDSHPRTQVEHETSGDSRANGLVCLDLSSLDLLFGELLLACILLVLFVGYGLRIMGEFVGDES